MTALERFLIQETGLPRKHIIRIYNAGHPWPLLTAYDVRRAGLIAQAKGLFFDEALAEAEAEVEQETRFANVGSDDQRRTSASFAEQLHPYLSLPWLRAIYDHVEEVAARTAFSPQTVFLFSLTVQRFAIERPGFELIGDFLDRQRLVC